LKHALECLAHVIFPPRCVACGTALPEKRSSFCSDCVARIEFINSPLCPLCGQPFSEPGTGDHLCGDCLLSIPPFSAARALGKYERVLMEVIHHFKYGGKTSLGEVLGGMMAEYSYPSFSIGDYSLIIPVPLHHRRLRQRGFNQALILAREISRRWRVDIDFLSLKRKVFTEPQVGLGRELREHNIKGAFAVADQGRIVNEKIVLVDDVYTTGSTVKECARVLMKCQAKEVAVLTLARAV